MTCQILVISYQQIHVLSYLNLNIIEVAMYLGLCIYLCITCVR